MFHKFVQSTEGIELPERFTYPFCYIPHKLCLMAAGQVRDFINSNNILKAEALKGKMFGVLIVKEKENGNIGFLSAFSGLLAGMANISYFVPPIYDLTDKNNFFRQEEANISDLNKKIKNISTSCYYNSCMQNLHNTEFNAEKLLKEEKEKLKFAKTMRDERRKAGVTKEEELEMIKQSQFQKAEYKRLEKQLKENIKLAKEKTDALNKEIESIKNERKIRSAALQKKIFQNFIVYNAKGEKRSIMDIFTDNGINMPPSGSGECAAPKLLQYAFSNNFEPLAIAEFWIGQSPSSEIRHDGYFYPACTSKCGPILGFMLKGLSIDNNPIALTAGKTYSPEIIYEDESVIIVNKPAGMLTVPGKIVAKSLYDYIISRYHDIDGPAIVHRLDMATSGLVIIARNKRIHEILQRQFEERTVVKHYYALLDGVVKENTGRIALPIRPDINNRPYQTVDFKNGKEAITIYKVLGRTDTETRIMFTPLTGRTHQLRIHSASINGLGCPIKGDMLYGKFSNRMYLHAGYIEFTHPTTGNRVSFESLPDF